MGSGFITTAPLHTFLSYCNESALEKEVLDCGAGGSAPPLALFHEHGYRTRGIEISPRQLARARRFCVEHHVELGIAQGDMRDLPFASASFSFVYSYASICHMIKSDIGVAMAEISRVLKPGGLCFVSFCAATDRRLGGVEPQEPGEYPFEDDGETGVHSLFEDDEPDRYFRTFTILRREKRLIESFSGQG